MALHPSSSIPETTEMKQGCLELLGDAFLARHDRRPETVVHHKKKAAGSVGLKPAKMVSFGFGSSAGSAGAGALSGGQTIHIEAKTAVGRA